MIFPDARTRVPPPAFPAETVDLLRRRDYRPTLVELLSRPDLSFSFLRPPGWDVGPPVMSPALDLPLPSLASFTRKDPPAGIELLLFEASFDCLPGDFLDTSFDALSLTHRSEGPLGDGWYSDRMGRRDDAYELLAAHRRGKDLFVFLSATPAASVARCRDELNTIIGTFDLKDPRPHPFADRWLVHEDELLDLSFAIPADATVDRHEGAARVTWPIDGGPVEIQVRCLREPPPQVPRIEASIRRELARKGILLDAGRAGDLPAGPGGIFSGTVGIRLYETEPNSERPVEVFLVVGRRDDGTRVRFTSIHPTRTANQNSWMRARFAIVQLATTMQAMS